MGVKYKELYVQAAMMVDKYQNEVVPRLRELLDKKEEQIKQMQWDLRSYELTHEKMLEKPKEGAAE